MIDCVHWEYERGMASMKYNIKHGGRCVEGAKQWYLKAVKESTPF